jgi:hypothetical protein
MNTRWTAAVFSAVLFACTLSARAQQQTTSTEDQVSEEQMQTYVDESVQDDPSADTEDSLNLDHRHPHPHPHPHPGPRWRWTYAYTDLNGCRECRFSCESVPCTPFLAGQKMACHRPGPWRVDDVYVCRRIR